MLGTTCAIMVAALNVPFMKGCRYGGVDANDKPDWSDVCYDPDTNPNADQDAYKGFVAETWGPFIILAIVCVLALVFG